LRLLDTDTCVEILRGNFRVIDARRQVDDIVTTTWITAGELYYGACKSLNPGAGKVRIDGFLKSLPVLALDLYSSQLFGVLKSNLEATGHRLADADLWIASTARRHGAILVTGNQRHYDRIERLRIENWIR
jgi:tRNA(fMet)-specific endonuclease VapC